MVAQRQTPAYRKAYKARPGVAEKMRVYQRHWRAEKYDTDPAYREKARAAARAWYRVQIADDATWSIRACKTVRLRALSEGVPFNLTPDDLKLPPMCPVFGIPFVMRGRNNPFNPSVDRLRTELGYVRGNVRVISRRANVIKSDSTNSAEVLAVALYMEREGL